VAEAESVAVPGAAEPENDDGTASKRCAELVHRRLDALIAGYDNSAAF